MGKNASVSRIFCYFVPLDLFVCPICSNCVPLPLSKDLVEDLRHLTGPEMEDFILGLMLTPEIYDSSTIYEIWSVSFKPFHY